SFVSIMWSGSPEKDTSALPCNPSSSAIVKTEYGDLSSPVDSTPLSEEKKEMIRSLFRNLVMRWKRYFGPASIQHASEKMIVLPPPRPSTSQNNGKLISTISKSLLR